MARKSYKGKHPEDKKAKSKPDVTVKEYKE